MKTKRTVFEVNDVYRVMENSELIYTLTNSEKLKREEYKYEQMEIEGLCLSDVLETLTPSRKKVAYAAIELYKRLKEGQVESPALLSSNNVYKMMHPIVREAFFWFFFGVTAQKEPRSRNPGQTGFLPSTLPILQSSLVRIAIIVIACHNHMVNQTDV